MSNRSTLTDQLRMAIDASGMTRREIGRQLGISESVMSRFMSGKGGLSIERIDALADLLGLHLTPRRKSRERRR